MAGSMPSRNSSLTFVGEYELREHAVVMYKLKLIL